MFNGMDKKTLAVIIGGAVLIILIGVVVWSASSEKTVVGGDPNINTSTGLGQGDSGPQTRFEVPENITVPDQNSTVSGDVAKPESVSAAAPGVDSKLRTFNISIDDDKFTPATVIANVNDIVRIQFTAVDKDYEITQPDYGYKRLIKKGETKPIEGQFVSEGKYVLYCSSCGGPEKGPVGYLIAVP